MQPLLSSPALCIVANACSSVIPSPPKKLCTSVLAPELMRASYNTPMASLELHLEAAEFTCAFSPLFYKIPTLFKTHTSADTGRPCVCAERVYSTHKVVTAHTQQGMGQMVPENSCLLAL